MLEVRFDGKTKVNHASGGTLSVQIRMDKVLRDSETYIVGKHYGITLACENTLHGERLGRCLVVGTNGIMAYKHYVAYLA